MRLNGALDGQPMVKKRRGRRKNVEGMDLLFMNRSRVPAVPDQASTVAVFSFSLCNSRSIFTLLINSIR